MADGLIQRHPRARWPYFAHVALLKKYMHLNMQTPALARIDHCILLLSVLASDYAGCLSALMKYPQVSDAHYFIDKALWLREPTVSCQAGSPNLIAWLIGASVVTLFSSFYYYIVVLGV